MQKDLKVILSILQPKKKWYFVYVPDIDVSVKFREALFYKGAKRAPETLAGYPLLKHKEKNFVIFNNKKTSRFFSITFCPKSTEAPR